MASTTSDSLPSSPSLPANAALDAAAEQEFSSHHHHSLFLPSSTSPASLYLDSSFQGLLAASSSSTPMSPSHQAPPLPPPPGPSKQPKKRPRASRRPPTTVLTTDTSNFRAMVQEFTGFPAPPFAAAPPPAVRPRLLGGASAVGPPFLLRPSPLKYPHNPVLLPPTCTTSTLANTNATTSGNNIGSTSSLVDALALFAKNNVLPSTAATAGGSSAGQYSHGMGGFNPFDDFEEAASAEGEKANAGHVFFSSLSGAGDKYDRH